MLDFLLNGDNKIVTKQVVGGTVGILRIESADTDFAIIGIEKLKMAMP